MKTKDRIISETSEETKQKARDCANYLITKSNMNSERIKEIQAETAYPQSRSVHQALLKVWNECEQEPKKETQNILDKLIKLNEKSIEENWKMSEVGEQFFKIFAYNKI